MCVCSSAFWLPPCFPRDREQKLACLFFLPSRFGDLVWGPVWGPGESTDLDSGGNADLRISLLRSGDHLIPPGLASPLPGGGWTVSSFLCYRPPEFRLSPTTHPTQPALHTSCRSSCGHLGSEKETQKARFVPIPNMRMYSWYCLCGPTPTLRQQSLVSTEIMFQPQAPTS